MATVHLPLPQFPQFAEYLDDIARVAPHLIIGITGKGPENPSSRFLSTIAERIALRAAKKRGEQIKVEVSVEGTSAVVVLYTTWPKQKVVLSQLQIDSAYFVLENILESRLGSRQPAPAALVAEAAQTVMETINPLDNARRK